MGKEKTSFNVGDMVFAKVRGYPAWPARISSVADARPASLKYNVYFFGTSETAAVLAKDICTYAENKEKLSKSVKRKYFKEGIEEIENEIKKIENGEESTLGLTPPGEEVETNKKNVRKSKKGDENHTDTTGDDSQGSNSIPAPTPAATPNQTTKGKKRKRESDENEAEAEEEIVPKKKRGNAKEKVEEPPDTTTKSEHISRSGRVIKPKKFLYDEEGEDIEPKSKAKNSSSPAKEPKEPKEPKESKEAKEAKEVKEAPASPVKSPVASPQENKKDGGMKKPLPKVLELNKSPSKSIPNKNSDVGRIMWVKAKNGEMVQIKLDVDRPSQFKDDKTRLRWERATEINAKRLKTEIEEGRISEEFKIQLKPTEADKANLSDEQLHNMKVSRLIERKRGKLRWLKLETRLVEIDVLIKTSLQKVKVDIDKALSLMDELINMPLDPLMLKKHPQVVDTTKKLRQYVGNLSEWNLTSEEKQIFEAKAYKIRQKANILFHKYTALFAVPENSNFWNVFLESVNEFAKLTENMPRERVYGLIIDPTSPYFKDVCEQETEEEEYKLKVKETKEEATEEKPDGVVEEPTDHVKTDESMEQ